VPRRAKPNAIVDTGIVSNSHELASDQVEAKNHCGCKELYRSDSVLRNSRQVDRQWENCNQEPKLAKEKMAKTDDAVAIARAAYEAYVAKDRAAIEKLIADDFHFTSPLDNRINRATYFARCWPNSTWIEDFDYINLVPDGDRVFVTYEGHSSKGKVFRNTEILTIHNGQIVAVEVYFGWSIPHKAEPGGFLSDGEDKA